MAYDKNIPLVLQLLRLDADIDGTAIARYTIEGDYSHHYCIMDASDDVDTMDIQGAIEETMHLILDNGGTPEDLRIAMGLVPEEEIEPDHTLEEEWKTPIDLGYCLDGHLMTFVKLPSDEIDPSDSEGAALNRQQVDNVQMAFNNLPAKLRLPAAKVLAQSVFQDYTEWQAFQICKAFEAGLDEGTVGRLIANPHLNHAQMRELRRIAEETDFTAPDASPYKQDIFKILASGEFSAEHLRGALRLIKATDAQGLFFMQDWLKLDSRQMEVASYALKSNVPMNVLDEYMDGSYSADHMNVITIALIEGMEKPGVARLLNPDLSMEQVWGFYRAISSGRFTNEQLDVLCDSAKPVEVMEAMRSGLTYGVDMQTLLRFADGSFTPEQMDALYLAATAKAITPETLGEIADASITPSQMNELRISVELEGADIGKIQAEKQAMPRSVEYAGQAGKAEALRDINLRDKAKESREASGKLVNEHGDDAHGEHDER